jgi:hypothetical protein
MAEGRSNAGIAPQLWVTEGRLEKHVHSILMKLPLPGTEDDHRRVLAVLTFLEARSRPSTRVTFDDPTLPVHPNSRPDSNPAGVLMPMRRRPQVPAALVLEVGERLTLPGCRVRPAAGLSGIA